ncbi:MAG: glycosyltransferase [candidate division FCPU426 bacterium]
MASPLSEYRKLIGETEYQLLWKLGATLRGLRVVMVNSTREGGGVAEILQNLVPLLNELGLDTTWEVIGGAPEFFNATKTLHNALHGRPEPLTPEMLAAYDQATEENSRRLRGALNRDLVFIHDPQPAGLIQALRKPEQKWVFRCHIDLSNPYPEAWEFLRAHIAAYDASVFSHPRFAQKLEHPQFMIAPSIDPLSDKNRELPDSLVRQTLERFGLDPERPLVTQISRFDKLKDPLGVIAAYRLVKKTHPDVQLLLAGGGASDDPESGEILARLREEAGKDPDLHLLDLPSGSNLEINALQRGSTVILQKSLREGFALTVSEALWKRKPVVASDVGGIPLQILHGKTGWLTYTVEGAAYYVRRVLNNPAESLALAKFGREHVRRNFLITRHLREYISLFHCVRQPGQNIIRL